MIHFDAVSKRFEGVEAVRDLDLQIPEGEIFGLLGPNGAGKTTSMRLLVGLLRPSQGRVLIGGHDMARGDSPGRALLGYIPDRPHLYEALSGNEYLEFVGGLWGVPPAEAVALGGEYLTRFRMADAAERMIEGYSHGMKQKLALAAAFLHDPAVLVIDEPMVGLDPRAARELRAIFRELGTAGKTVVLSTHQLEVAEAVCDRIGVINEGRLVALGTMDELREGAQAPGSSLEALFLRLTEEIQEQIAEAVAATGAGAGADA